MGSLSKDVTLPWAVASDPQATTVHLFLGSQPSKAQS